MKLRHHRKRRNALVLRNARRFLFARSAGLQLSSWFARFVDRQMARQEFIQSLELSPAEQAARQIVQDAEMFDRTLDHYVRPGGLEAIPAQHHMGTSMRYYEQRMREACRQYGTELRTLARRYSCSREYEQWLRENPPEARR